MGRRRLVGCRRSRAASATSLKRYIAPLRPQKIAKAATAVHRSGVSICWEKITPANTKRFLIHCRGRSDARRARGVRTPGPATTGSGAGGGGGARGGGGGGEGGEGRRPPRPAPSRDALGGGAQGAGHAADLVLGQLREARQGQHLGGRARSMGEGAIGVGHGEHRLGGNGNRIVHGGAAPRLAKGGDEGVPLRR